MNPIRIRLPIIGTLLTAVLIAGVPFAPSSLEAQRVRNPAAKAQAPAIPCCEITAIDARARLVTAKNLESGETFQFRVTDRRLLGSLKVGQSVYADQAAKKVGITPGDPCCTIVAPAQPINDISLPDVAPAQPVNGMIDPAQPVDTDPAVQSSQARTSELEAIVARARDIEKPVRPQDLRQFNLRMAPVRAALQSWAAKHDVELVTRRYSCADLTAASGGQPAASGRRPNTVVSCPSYVRSGNDDCDLVGATMVGDEMICEYDCYPSADLDRQDDDVKVMQENS
jgi:hypothetical protein